MSLRRITRRVLVVVTALALMVGACSLVRQPLSGGSLARKPTCTVLEGHTSWINTLAFSPDGSRLASGGAAQGTSLGELKLWDVGGRRQMADLPVRTGTVHALAFAPDGRTLSAGGWDPDAQIWDLGTGVVRYVPLGGRGRVIRMIDAPGRGAPAVLSFDPVRRRLSLWDAETDLDALTDEVPCHGLAAFAKDGRHMAWTEYGVSNTGVRVWDLESGARRRFALADGAQVGGLAVSPDGRTLAVGSLSGGVELWDIGTGRLRKQLGDHDSPTSALEYSPDGRVVAVASRDRLIRLWEVETGEQRAVLCGHTATIYALAFSPDGGFLASGGFDKTVRLWNLARSERRWSLW